MRITDLLGYSRWRPSAGFLHEFSSYSVQCSENELCTLKFLDVDTVNVFAMYLFVIGVFFNTEFEVKSTNIISAYFAKMSIDYKK